MPRKDWPYGSLVDKETRRIRWMAPTTLQKGDPNDHHGGGCLRKFFYRYVLGLKDEERTFQALGNECHAEIEHHLTTGANTLGRITSAAKCYIPDPDITRAKLLVEHDIGGGNLELATFGVNAGYFVPFVGYTDVIRANTDIPGFIQGTGQAVNQSGDGTFDDPPGTIEALDWKFGGGKKGTDKDYSLTGPELASDTQMVTYGVWSIWKTPSISAPIRPSHVYTNTKGRPESSKATILIPRDNLLKRWEYVTGAVRTLVDVARESDPERVPGNKAACESFGGCPYAGAPCQVPIDSGLETFFGGDETMSILDSLNIPGMTPPAPVVAAGPGGVAAALGLDITSQMQALAAASGASVEPPPFKPAQPTKEFVDAVAAIHAKGYGMVPLTGEAAQMFGVLNQHPNVVADYKYAGSGDLAKTNAVAEPARVIAIAREMAPLPQKPGTPVAQTPAVSSPMGLVSNETPASDPAKAALPVEGFASPSAVTPNVQVPGLIASVPPAAAAQVAATAPAAAPTNVAATVTEEPKKEKGKPGRKPKAPKADGTPAATNEPGDDARWLFIDCIPNVAYEDCARFVSEWSTGLARHFKLAAPYDDVRMAPKDHPLAYGAWKGALSGVAKNAAASLPPGAYYVSTDSELGAAIAEGFTFARAKNADGTDGDPAFELIVRGVPRR